MNRLLIFLSIVSIALSCKFGGGENTGSGVKDAESSSGAGDNFNEIGLTCSAMVERIRQDDPSFRYGEFGAYFEEIEGSAPLSAALKSTLLRKSVALFHGNLRASQTDEAVDGIGEGVSFSKVRGLNNEVYWAVNVGFGGGNSATYIYHDDGNANLESVMSNDGDCEDRGTSPSFPFEGELPETKKSRVECMVQQGNSPFGQFFLSTRITEDGTYTGAPLYITPRSKSPQAVSPNVAPSDPRYVKFRQPLYKRDSRPAIRYWNDQPRVHGIFSTKGQQRMRTDPRTGEEQRNVEWHISISVSMRGQEFSVSGRAYPKVRGGAHASDRVEFRGQGRCLEAIPVTKAVFYRMLKY